MHASLKKDQEQILVDPQTSGGLLLFIDPIFGPAILTKLKTRFKKAGVYHIRLEQLMREDPLQNVLSAGLRVERVP